MVTIPKRKHDDRGRPVRLKDIIYREVWLLGENSFGLFLKEHCHKNELANTRLMATQCP